MGCRARTKESTRTKAQSRSGADHTGVMSDPGSAGHIDDVEVLGGGVANAGAVTREGPFVLRPSNANTESVHRFLRHVRANGFDGASEPVGIDADGRERLVFIPGDVAIPPYPLWAQADSAVASAAALVRRLHDASRGFDLAGCTWSAEMSDPDVSSTGLSDPGPSAGETGTDVIVCHNDVCMENLVFRDGEAVGIVDFDFAAPGRVAFDLAQFGRMCVPVDDPDSLVRFGWRPSDQPARLRLLADAYGLDSEGRGLLIEVLAGTIARGGEFVSQRVERGEQAFIDMWNSMGGMARFDRRRAWWTIARADFEAAADL